jgi:hypothetical protein
LSSLLLVDGAHGIFKSFQHQVDVLIEVEPLADTVLIFSIKTRIVDMLEVEQLSDLGVSQLNQNKLSILKSLPFVFLVFFLVEAQRFLFLDGSHDACVVQFLNTFFMYEQLDAMVSSVLPAFSICEI